jgi:outer membrane protein assembly factor BamB
MKHLAGVMAIVLLAGPAAAQNPYRVHTRPLPPPPEALDRLNLRMAWRVYLPTDGVRDGIDSVQVLADMLLVQLRSGGVVALNPETGQTIWRTRAGLPYLITQIPGTSPQSVFVTSATRIYALDRATGGPQWALDLPNTPSAPPTADLDFFYVPIVTGRMNVYQLPKLTEPDAVPEAGRQAGPSPTPAPAREGPMGGVAGKGSYAATAIGPRSAAGQAGLALAEGIGMRLLWDYSAGSRIEQTPLLARDLVIVAAGDGNVVVLHKLERQVVYRFPMDAPVSGPPAQYGDVIYLPGRDSNLYALETELGRLRWRFTAGGSILQQPAVTVDDVFVAPERAGLSRVQRSTGEPIWRSSPAARFLAANKKFVYAFDRTGNLLVIDYARGTVLSAYDAHEFVIPVTNDQTDRLYLAANHGLLVCLHDRDYPAPITNRRPPEKKPAAKPAKPAAPPEKADEAMPDKPEKPDKPDKPRPAPKPKEKPEKPADKEMPDKSDKPKPEKPDKPDKPKPEKAGES